jgi:hypothetical protein
MIHTITGNLEVTGAATETGPSITGEQVVDGTMTIEAGPVALIRISPVQQRSQDRLQQIEAAAREVLARVGRDRLTTAMVAELAGCSIGSVYRYFADRVAILDAIAPDRNGRTLTTPAEVAAMPRGSALLCVAGEVFWLPPAYGPGALRVWFAAGYDPIEFIWTDEQVADWAPLTVLHTGALEAPTARPTADAVGDEVTL